MSNLPIRTREEIIAELDLREDTVEVPEWKTSLQLRGLSMQEWNRITNLSTRKDGTINNLRMNIFTFIAGVVNPKFTDEDYDALVKKGAVIMRIANSISELSGVTKDSLGSALKNSASAPTDD